MFSQIPQYQQLRWLRSSVSGFLTLVLGPQSSELLHHLWSLPKNTIRLKWCSRYRIVTWQPGLSTYLSANLSTYIYLYWIIVLVNHSRCICNRTPLKWSPLGATLQVWNMEPSVNSGASSIFLVGMAMCTQAVEHDKTAFPDQSPAIPWRERLV